MLRHGLLDQGTGQMLTQLAGLAKTGFELVAERHQLIDFGDDAVLFWEWGQGNNCLFDFPEIQIGLRPTSGQQTKLIIVLNEKIFHGASMRVFLGRLM